MQSMLMLIQVTAQNIALFCCALFAGAATYVSLVEHPAMVEGGRELTGTYILLAQPRPAFFLTSFAVLGALGGMSAGIAGGSIWWLAGGVVLGIAALFQMAAVTPETRRLAEMAMADDAKVTGSFQVSRLARLHALQSLAGLAALFAFIMKY